MPEYLMQILGEIIPPRFRVQFDVEGDISLMMHVLLTELADHIKIIDGADGVKVRQINKYIGGINERRTEGTI